jgi:8-oxo-dGTP pyrophosphatase MutT (NUDIX family)
LEANLCYADIIAALNPYVSDRFRKKFFRKVIIQVIESRLGGALVENFWRRLVRLLPLYAAEGGHYTEVSTTELLKDTQCSEPMLILVQELLAKSGVLDLSRLAEGKWRFVSYPARLFACSLLSLLANEKNIFEEGFWATDVNDSVAEQHRVLHCLETLRKGTAEKFPIRRTFVAWGIVKRGRHFVLKRRENPDSDPDNTLHGNYGFPGGRVNLRDIEACGAGESITAEQKLAFLYGVPEPMTEEEENLVEHALEYTLMRELREELGFEHKIHYTFSKASCHMPPETFIHGANAQHCITECRITLFDVSLTPEGDAFLTSTRKSGELFTLEEILSPWSGERKVFFDTSNTVLAKYLENLTDSAEALQIKRSDLSASDAKNRKNTEPLYAILPLSSKEPLILGGYEAPIADPRYVELLLILGLAAREGFRMRLLSGALDKKNWGWLLLDSDMRVLANKCNHDMAQICGAPLLLIRNSLCRLRLSEENIFFSPDLFRAELRESFQGAGELTIYRRSLDFKGLFHLDAESFFFDLSSHNYGHLRNLQEGKTDIVTYDNLRKLQTRGNQRMDDLVRQYGLYQRDKPLDASLSKERQEFRFAIHVD